MEPLVLTSQELRDLTGYAQPSKQAEVLRKAGIRHIVGPDGHPRVARVWLTESPTSSKNRRTEPALGALRRGQKANT